MKSLSKKRTSRLLAFGPALVMICATTFVASGASVVGSATGASSTIDVTGNVAAGMSVTPDTTSACTGGTNAIAAIGDFSDGAYHEAGAPCTISFATNSTNGAYVTIDDADAVPFFCTNSCTAGTNDSVENVAAAAGGSALANDTFGAALLATTGTPKPVAGTNFENEELDGTPGVYNGATTIWAPVDAAPSRICETTALTTATQGCTFTFGVDGQGATQTAGAYSGTANILATANP